MFRASKVYISIHTTMGFRVLGFRVQGLLSRPSRGSGVL